MAPHEDPLAHAEQTARQWLARIGAELGTDDHRFVYRVVRAWLHGVRDVLTVESAVHLGAQLPEVLRGTYYEGWAPHRVPLRHDVPAFAARFASEARISVPEVRRVTNAVTAALNELFSPGQIDHALALMPRALREAYFERAPKEREIRSPRQADRLDQLRDDVDLIADAVSTLAHGLEHRPDAEPGDDDAARAARTVHDIMLVRDAAHRSPE